MTRFAEQLTLLQSHLRAAGLDGWLLYDFRRSNILACKAIGIPTSTTLTRRWLVWLPAVGDPIKIVHAIESHVLDFLPFRQIAYSGRVAYEAALDEVLLGSRNIAMEYSHHNGNPYLSRVDAGTVDSVRSRGINVHSSGDLLQHLTAVLTHAQIKSHRIACEHATTAMNSAFDLISQRLNADIYIDEKDVVDYLCDYFTAKGLFYDHPPQCAVNANSANPHYVPEKDNCLPIRRGDWILIDLWCKQAHDDAVWADITEVGVAAPNPSDRQKSVFTVVAAARDAAHNLIATSFSQGRPLRGAAVDDAARSYINEAGYAEFFTHRTGHNLGESIHGDGCHLDNFETCEERHLLPGTCCTIEPGIYLPGEFGVRLEHDVFIDHDGKVSASTPPQHSIRLLL